MHGTQRVESRYGMDVEGLKPCGCWACERDKGHSSHVKSALQEEANHNIDEHILDLFLLLRKMKIPIHLAQSLAAPWLTSSILNLPLSGAKAS